MLVRKPQPGVRRDADGTRPFQKRFYLLYGRPFICGFITCNGNRSFYYSVGYGSNINLDGRKEMMYASVVESDGFLGVIKLRSAVSFV